MTFSKKTEYALRALLQFARVAPAGGYLQTRDLARQESMPSKFLEGVLLALRQLGYLESKVGPGGGYRLARPAGQVRVSAVLADLEGDSQPTSTKPAGHDRPLGQAGVDLVARRVCEAHARALDGLTLDALLDEAARAAAASGTDMYYI